MRELPRLRRLRQPGLGPRQSRRRGRSTTRTRSRVPIRSAPFAGLPSDEGADDDAEPARHGEPRPDALARRPHRRQRSGRRRRSTRTRRSRSSTSRSPGLLGRDGAAHRRRDAGVHRLHPAGHLSAEPDPRPRQLADAATQQAGRDFFFGRDHRTSSSNCNGCHALDPARRASSAATGCSTLRERAADLQDPAPAQPVPEGRHVRHAGGRRSSTPATTATRATRSAASASCTTAASTRCSASCTRRVFNLSAADAAPTTQRRDVEQFMLAFDIEPGADRRPAGDARRRDATRRPSAPRIDLLIARADGAASATVVKGVLAGEARGWLRRRRRHVPSDRAAEPPLADAALRALAGDGRAGAHLHLRAARLGRAHRRRPRRGRLLRPRRARRRQRSGRSGEHAGRRPRPRRRRPRRRRCS